MRQLLSDIELIPDDHRRGKTFERAVKWLLENVPETRSQFKKVWPWDDYPDREGRDLGIDLVAETIQGTRWTIQAKYRTDKSTTLTRDDLNSFSALSFAHCNNIDYGLVTHTTVNPIKKLPVFLLPALDS
jgi:predicted helicase